MAQIRYFWRDGYGHAFHDLDEITDGALDRYPAPTGGHEYAAATLASGAVRYGYDGAWHASPPADVLAAESHADRVAVRRAEDEAIRALPSVTITRVATSGVMVETQDGEQEVAWDELREAAMQPDRVAATLYGSILAAAEQAERHDYLRTRIVVRT